jgi:uncharacterized protein YndB with AHSA1/START domain
MSEAPEDGDGHSSDERFRSGGIDRIELDVRVNAVPAVVWAACASARGLAGWQADRVEGELERGKVVELSWPALGASILLDIVDVQAPRRIVMQNGQSQVELAVGEQGVTLVHSGIARSDDVAGIAASWQIALGLLAHFCERHTDQPRSVHWFIGPTYCTAGAAHAFFTDAGALSSWLTRRGGISDTGSALELELRSGARLSGRVLANVPGHDVAFSWDEDEASALCLRTLPVAGEPEQRLVALSWSRWTSSPPPSARLEELEAAHARLLRAVDRRGWA